MRVGLVPENPLEWILNKFGFVPRAMLETFNGAVQARSVMIAAKLGIFESLAAGSQSKEQIAAATGADTLALEKLLRVLAATKYLRLRHGKWELPRNARRWVLRSGRHSIADNLLHAFVQWKSLDDLEQFILTGEPIDIHDHMSVADWAIYQRSMKSIADLGTRETVGQVRLPPEPRRMLDLGGSHGTYSAAFCRRYPTLSAVILDLPIAVEHASPLLAEQGLGSRIVHRVGNALTDCLGEQEWDFVFACQLMHHFKAGTNEELCRRIARSLKPGGMFVISELERSSDSQTPRQFEAVFDLFFSLTSGSGAWSVEQMQGWQAKAGLRVNSPTRLWTMPGVILAPAEAMAT